MSRFCQNGPVLLSSFTEEMHHQRSSLISAEQLLEQNCFSTGPTASLTCVSVLNVQNTARPGIARQQIHLINIKNKQRVIRVFVHHHVAITSHPEVTSWQKARSPMVTAGNTYLHTFAGACMCCHIAHSIKALRLAPFSSLWAEAERRSDIFMTCGVRRGCVLRRAGGVKPQECSGRFSGSSRLFPAAARPL